MKKFKYQRVSNPSDEELETLGNDGWELTGICSDYAGSAYVFKQEIEGIGTSIGNMTAPSNTNITPEERVLQEAVSLYPGQKLAQVKYVKETLRTGLKEAKDLVDDWHDRHPY